MRGCEHQARRLVLAALIVASGFLTAGAAADSPPCGGLF